MGWLSDQIQSLWSLVSAHASRHIGVLDPIPEATALSRGLMSASDKSRLDALGGGIVLRGSIHVSADFPTLAAVQLGWAYIVDDSVTDNAPGKTGTGQSFAAGELIAWNGTAWTLLDQDIAHYAVRIVHGDYTTAGSDEFVLVDTFPATIRLATSALGVPGKIYLVKNASGIDGIVVEGEGGEDIEGDTSWLLPSGACMTVLNRDGTRWVIV